MPLNRRELEACLRNKFHFQPDTTHSDDHHWYKLKLPGLPPIRTFVSHSGKDIDVGLEAKIARQLRVKKVVLRGMVACTNSCEDYYHQVKEDPFPPWNIRF